MRENDAAFEKITHLTVCCGIRGLQGHPLPMSSVVWNSTG